MRLKISDLWRWEGTSDRGAYLLLGMILFAAKFSLDRSVSWLMFDREWSVIDYVRAGALPWRAFQASEDRVYWLTLLALALPFLWAGTGLTLRRLRSAGLPLWLTALFVELLVRRDYSSHPSSRPQSREEKCGSLRASAAEELDRKPDMTVPHRHVRFPPE